MKMSVVTSPPASEFVTAQTLPLPSTTVSHIGLPKPPLGVPVAGTTWRSKVCSRA